LVPPPDSEDVFQTNSPKAEGLTAIEAWVIACIIFVFGALGEYTVILLKIKIKKLAPKRSSRRPRTRPAAARSLGANGGGTGSGNADRGLRANHAATSTTATSPPAPRPFGGRPAPPPPPHLTFPALPLRRDNYGRTDLVFLVVFPILFLIFNLFYWISLYWWRWDDAPGDAMHYYDGT